MAWFNTYIKVESIQRSMSYWMSAHFLGTFSDGFLTCLGGSMSPTASLAQGSALR
ncbi:hypothetical protein JCM19239_6491 [Vibrio variabilis]|uniref:Uncharacterized protein n=1 Tax=Vibrio variabilis TaxID=990271 RepID=A0ABQ0JJF2_9VIBR|nr:hypothetical protein JCM19239_6491 [Vibrio variabilis]